MSGAYASAPKNLRSLRDRVMHVSRRDGLAFGRLQQHIGLLVVAQFMGALTDEEGQPQLLIKGGSALELRRGLEQSRASRDLDAVTRHDLEIIWQALATASSRGWEGFTAVLTEPEVIEVPGLALRPRRFTVKLRYQGAPFVSVPVEVSPQEAGNTDDVDWTHSPAFELIGLPLSQPIPCMTIPWQIAQKLHAVTAKLPEGRTNDRAHDLVDLQILQALIVDESLVPVRQACIEVFEGRGQQAWPPTVTALGYWHRIYVEALSSVEGLGLAPDVREAAMAVNFFIQKVDEAEV
ncbi:MAG: nucleotidyl transferase AbiEii/AbiGii toxin family protein [Candidatus Nanopelagicales bacterium]|nr:nucleotidyl transferase AbiEii/AbiGii toxin family protein [Candidatus Nanopelagicales bacterium]